MIYKFKSKAAADVIIMGPGGDQVLRIIGKEPASVGIIGPAALPAAIEAIYKAIAQEETQGVPAELEAAAEGRVPSRNDGVTLRQRTWPLVEMMKRARDEEREIVWNA